jgi:multimeric flavodoxin WrbA
LSAGGVDRPATLILFGSARSNGDTAVAARALAARLGSGGTLVDLATKRILPFDYANSVPKDDFSALADLMLAHAAIVFVTPVYWYSMSGLMKTFFDRLSDLLGERDEARRGRALAERDVWLLAVGTDSALPRGFDAPFAMTADYFGMKWRGAFYIRSGKKADASDLERLAAQLGAPPAPAAG